MWYMGGLLDWKIKQMIAEASSMLQLTRVVVVDEYPCVAQGNRLLHFKVQLYETESGKHFIVLISPMADVYGCHQVLILSHSYLNGKLVRTRGRSSDFFFFSSPGANSANQESSWRL